MATDTVTAVEFVIVGGAAQDVAAAVTRLARCRVAYTASIGDAASPVYVQAGAHRENNHGQVADYRHDVAAWAERQGMASVIGCWSGDERGWCYAVTLPAGSDVTPEAVAEAVGRRTLAQIQGAEIAAHRRMVRDAEKAEAERPAREARKAAYAAECAARAEEYRPIYDAARGKVRVKANGQPHRGDLRDLEYAYGKACGTVDCYGEYDRTHGLRLLTRLAEQGFAEPATA